MQILQQHRGYSVKSIKSIQINMQYWQHIVIFLYYDSTACWSSSGVLGIKVKIMLPWDPSGKIGPKKPLPDHVSIVEPKEEILPTTPISEQKGAKPEVPVMPQGAPVPTS